MGLPLQPQYKKLVRHHHKIKTEEIGKIEPDQSRSSRANATISLLCLDPLSYSVLSSSKFELCCAKPLNL